MRQARPRHRGARTRSSVQLFAAGIVFAAVALELLPDIMHERSTAAAVVGLTLGIGLMLGDKKLTEKFGRKTTGGAALLYLVTEELLVEAHEEPETPLLTAMFFVGFVALLVSEMLA
jgi:zinc transporter ZupT